MDNWDPINGQIGKSYRYIIYIIINNPNWYKQ